jgi:hypothetical protein
LDLIYGSFLRSLKMKAVKDILACNNFP